MAILGGQSGQTGKKMSMVERLSRFGVLQRKHDGGGERKKISKEKKEEKREEIEKEKKRRDFLGNEIFYGCHLIVKNILGP